MALANYTDLKVAIADWAMRTDLTARIPDFITLAEAELNPRLTEQTTLVGAPFKLTDAAPTNALLTEFPNVYLFTALSHAGPFLKDDGMLARFRALAADAWAALVGKYGKGRTALPLTTDLPLQRTTSLSGFLNGT